MADLLRDRHYPAPQDIMFFSHPIASKIRGRYQLEMYPDWKLLTTFQDEDQFFFECMERLEFIFMNWDVKEYRERLPLKAIEHGVLALSVMHTERAFSERFAPSPVNKGKALEAMTNLTRILRDGMAPAALLDVS